VRPLTGVAPYEWALRWRETGRTPDAALNALRELN
jgi:hypothetical protein